MKQESIAGPTMSYPHRIWLAVLGAIEVLQTKSRAFFRELVKEGEQVEARNKAGQEQKPAQENTLTGAVIATREAYQKKLEAQLQEWDTQLDQLKTKAGQAQTNVRLRIEDEVENLKAKRAALQTKLDELRNRGGDAWDDLREGAEKAWNDVSDALNKALARFK